MATEVKLEEVESVPSGLKSELVEKLGKERVASGNERVPSDGAPATSSSEDATSKGKADTASTFMDEVVKGSMSEHGIYNAPHTANYNYGYPGFNGSLRMDDYCYFQANNSPTSENGSMVYYMSGNPYGLGSVIGVNGQTVGQQPYFNSTGYLQSPVSYGSEVFCSSNSTYAGNVPNGKIGVGRGKTGLGSSKSSGLSAHDRRGIEMYNSTYAQPGRAVNKVVPVGSDMSTGLPKGYPPAGKFSYGGQKQGQFTPNGPFNYRQNGKIWQGNDRFRSRDRFSKSGDSETSAELICGPRGSMKSVTSDDTIKKDSLGVTVFREQYNQPDFQTDYTNAKFYVIKSYNEDDIYKSIKYSVWSSTANGNKKLNAAFHESEKNSSETGTKCPIFLFFSVNGSGQFVGIAEMVGQVDFEKDMDFWQVDKWMGFFPVAWQIVKDIPNSQLRHIILENNDGRPVTHSRDTQEIPHKQGLEMLNIFKNYSSKTSLLDDFNFYETREKSFNAKKIKPGNLRLDVLNTDGGFDQENGEEGFEEDFRTKKTANHSSLINMTKNLTVNGYNAKTTGIKKPTEKSIAAVFP